MNLSFNEAFKTVASLQAHAIAPFIRTTVLKLAPQSLSEEQRQDLQVRTNVIARNMGINKPITIVDNHHRLPFMEAYGSVALPFKLTLAANSHCDKSTKALIYQLIKLKFNYNLKNYLVTTLAATATFAGTYFYFKRPQFLASMLVASAVRNSYSLYQHFQAKALSERVSLQPPAPPVQKALPAPKAPAAPKASPAPKAPAAQEIVPKASPEPQEAPESPSTPPAPPSSPRSSAPTPPSSPRSSAPQSAAATVLSVVVEEKPSEEQIARWRARIDVATTEQKKAILNLNRSPNTKKGKNKKERLGNQVATLEKEIRELQNKLPKKF